jgi:hypothetical protein
MGRRLYIPRCIYNSRSPAGLAVLHDRHAMLPSAMVLPKHDVHLVTGQSRGSALCP